MPEYLLDDIDRKIIRFLQIDARTPYTDIASKLNVSHGTIHQRVERMQRLGVIKRMTIDIDSSKVGYPIQTIIGVTLHKPSEYKNILKKLENCPEVTEAYYTTGGYTFMIQVYCTSISHLHKFLTETLQKIDLVSSTETMLILDIPIQRHLGP